ncbi:hypothetical protein HYU14_01010 [Candidatus Woesearchaeota archaeon]|nr:hypothetical protein [Candidatus Woesearchaeota archaeon]
MKPITLMTNKKSNVYMAFSMLFVLFIIISTLYIQIRTKTFAYTNKIGDTQIRMLSYLDKAQKTFIAVDLAAQYSLPDAIFGFLEKGGYPGPTPCQQASQFTVWENIDPSSKDLAPPLRNPQKPDWDSDCKPSRGQLLRGFTEIFNREINPYLEKHPDKNLPLDNYDLIIKDENGITMLKGIAAQPLLYPSSRGMGTIKDIPAIRANALASITNLQEKQCLEKPGKVPFFRKNQQGFEFLSCGSCPKEGTCQKYINEAYCNADPCGLQCFWENNKCDVLQNVFYAEKPSFALPLGYDPIKEMETIAEKVKAFKEQFVGCIKTGGTLQVVISPSSSSSPSPSPSPSISSLPSSTSSTTQASQQVQASDAEECIALLSQKSEFAQFNVQSQPQQDHYFLTFEILSGYRHPYDNAQPSAKIGLRFWDIYPPPKVTSFQQKSTFFTWDKNPASDLGKLLLFGKPKSGSQCPDKPKDIRQDYGDPEELPPAQTSYEVKNIPTHSRTGKSLSERLSLAKDALNCIAILPVDTIGNEGEPAFAEYASTGNERASP